MSEVSKTDSGFVVDATAIARAFKITEEQVREGLSQQLNQSSGWRADFPSSDVGRDFPCLESFQSVVADHDCCAAAGWYGEQITGCGVHVDESLQSPW